MYETGCSSLGGFHYHLLLIKIDGGGTNVISTPSVVPKDSLFNPFSKMLVYDSTASMLSIVGLSQVQNVHVF